MPNWITVTESHLRDRKMAPLLDALKTAALGEDQADPTPEIIASCTNRIRAEIASCPNNRLDADATTIPKDLLDLACRMIIRAMKDRLELEWTPAESRDAENDLRYLERIASCKVTVAQPDTVQNPPEVQAGGGVQVVSKSPRVATRETLDGL